MDQMINDVKKLVQRLNAHDTAADALLSETANLKSKLIAMRQYRDSVVKLNEVAKHRPKSTLILGSQLENQRIQELENENRELHISLAEHQSALEIIMSKYREQMDSVLKVKNQNHSWISIACDKHALEQKALKEKIVEMAAVMRTAASIDETAMLKEVELRRSLQVENEVLRELLEISGRRLHSAHDKSAEDLAHGKSASKFDAAQEDHMWRRWSSSESSTSQESVASVQESHSGTRGEERDRSGRRNLVCNPRSTKLQRQEGGVFLDADSRSGSTAVNYKIEPLSEADAFPLDFAPVDQFPSEPRSPTPYMFKEENQHRLNGWQSSVSTSIPSQSAGEVEIRRVIPCSSNGSASDGMWREDQDAFQTLKESASARCSLEKSNFDLSSNSSDSSLEYTLSSSVYDEQDIESGPSDYLYPNHGNASFVKVENTAGESLSDYASADIDAALSSFDGIYDGDLNGENDDEGLVD